MNYILAFAHRFGDVVCMISTISKEEILQLINYSGEYFKMG